MKLLKFIKLKSTSSVKKIHKITTSFLTAA